MPQIFLLLAISILATAGAQLCLKKGVLMLGELNFSILGIFQLILRVFQNIYLTGGIFLFGFSFFVWLFILSRIQLNIAYPIAVSLEISMVSLGTWFFFHEYFSLSQIIGIIVVIIGIFLVLPKGTL